MSPLTQQYIDLCARYSTKPNADVAIWSSFIDAPPAGLEDVPPPPPPPPQPLEENQVWKGILDRQALCNCSRLPVWLQERQRDTHWLTGLHGAGATLVVRPNKGARPEYFTDLDMLALCDLLADVEVLQSLDLSRCRLGPSGVILLCSRVLASPRCKIVSLDLSNQTIDSTAAKYLASAARANRNLVSLLLHNCGLGNEGGLVFAELLVETPQYHALKHLDLSNNIIPFQTCTAIEAVSKIGTPEDAQGSDTPLTAPTTAPTPTSVNMDGNRVFDEVLNAVSHGVSFLLALVGTVLLAIAVHGLPAHYQWSVALYAMSLCVLFLASTLYHSFFALKTTRYIFEILDHSAIYLLIAGSYTPILAIVFPDNPIIGRWLVYFMWGCACLGITVAAAMSDGTLKKRLSLAFYLGMGWAAVLILPQILARLSSASMSLIVGGGVLYTLGVPFFVRNKQTLGVPDHTIWHVFVLLGALAHYLFIYWHVVPFAGYLGTQVQVPTDLRRLHAPML